MKSLFTKISALVLDGQGKLLVVKGKGDDFYKAFGGKVEGLESDIECLSREIMEEGMVEMLSASLYIEPPLTQIENKPNEFFTVRFYLVSVNGQPRLNPDDNNEELRWISRTEFEDGIVKCASGLRLYAIPKLIEDGLMR